jgi:hypothetical protein
MNKRKAQKPKSAPPAMCVLKAFADVGSADIGRKGSG